MTIPSFAMHDLGCRFAHNHLVSGNESNNRIGTLLDKFDELGIDNDGVSIEPCEFNHRSPPFIQIIGGIEEILNASKSGDGSEATINERWIILGREFTVLAMIASGEFD